MCTNNNKKHLYLWFCLPILIWKTSRAFCPFRNVPVLPHLSKTWIPLDGVKNFHFGLQNLVNFSFDE
jgi:hypothetical protein